MFVLYYKLDVIDDLYKMVNKHTGKNTPMISDYHHGLIMKHADRLNSAIIYDRDFNYNYFGFKVNNPTVRFEESQVLKAYF